MAIHAAEGPAQRWNPWNVVMAILLTAAVYALERLWAVAPVDALVDATFVGFISFLIFTWWRE